MNDATSGRRPTDETGVLARWWSQPDQFAWLTAYLTARNLQLPIRRMMTVICGAMMFLPLGVLATGELPALVSATISIAATATGVGYAIMWLRGWPTRAQSLSMGVLGAILIALGSVLQTAPEIALLGCGGLAITGAYLAFFHDARAVTCNLLIATVAGTICAVRVAAQPGHALAAAAGGWLVLELCLAVPLAVQVILRTLGADVVRSDHDALTGLLNRRAFYERARALVTSPASDVHLIVIMVDLDKFKVLNDTYGHQAGDEALAAVGWALRRNSRSSSLVGRAGGEEFLVIDAVPGAELHQLPELLCEAVAALPHPVTASVGAAVMPWRSVSDPSAVIEKLIGIADRTMYDAKRSGGNRAAVSVLSEV